MNFSINKTAFSSTASIVSHAISSTSPQPSLRGMKITAKDNTLILTGSDADISIEKTITANDSNNLVISEEGSILIEAKYLLDIVKKLDSEIITIEVLDGALTRFSGNSAVFKINGMNVNDYPTIDFSRPADSISIQSSILSEIIEETTFATAIKETRPVLTGVHFSLKDHVLTCTATDSYRLAKKTLPFNVDASFDITIPAKSLNEIRSTMILDQDQMIVMAMSDKKAQFYSDDMLLQTRLLDGGYPDTDRLIPDAFDYKLTINRMDLIHAIDRTTFIKSDNMNVNRLQCSANEVILTSKSQEIGESRESLTATFEGEDLDISFSGSYVLEAARAFKSDTIMIQFKGDMRPFILTDSQDETILQLVLPVRTYN